MIQMPKKRFFEGKGKYISRIADAFENQGHLDPLNAHYATQFWLKAKGATAEMIIAAIKKLISEGGDVTVLMNIKLAIDEIKAKHK